MEFLDIRDKNGNPTGEVKERSLVHADGDIHGTSHVWIVRKNEKGSYDYGNIALKPYDMNTDGVVNAKDYLIYYYEKRDTLGDDYWQFGNNYLLRRRS